MQLAALNLETGNQKDCKRFLEEGKAALDSMTDIDHSVHASFFWVSSQDHKSRLEFSAFYKDTLLYSAYTSVESLSEVFQMVHLIEGMIDQVEGTVHVSWVQPRVLGIPQVKSLRDCLDSWMGKLHTTLLSVEAETSDLVAS